MHKDNLKEPYGPEIYASAASQQIQGTEEIGSTQARAIAGNSTTILLTKWLADLAKNTTLACLNIVLKVKHSLIPRGF